MPFIRFSLSHAFTDSQAKEAGARVGRLITHLEGKDESRLMLEFQHAPHMFFRGAPLDNGAFIECRILGPQTTEAKRRFTEELCKALEEIFGIPPSDTFLQFVHTDDWGAAGTLKTV